MPRTHPSRRASLRWLSPSLLVLGLLGTGGSSWAQVPSGCPNVCNQKYALCIAASCDADGNCGKCSATDGSCGYCYVFEGESCSYGKPCSDLMPSGTTVYSTYSEVLASTFGFQAMACSSSAKAADCMDGQCTLTGQTVTLTDKQGREHQIPTAVCQCRITQPGGLTLGGQCNTANCSAIWSTAYGVLEHQPQCPQ